MAKTKASKRAKRTANHKPVAVACARVCGADIFAEAERRFKEFSFAWLPQETAPNGVDVLVVRGNEYGIAQRAGADGNYFESKGGDFSNQIDGWMPLPPPPPNPSFQGTPHETTNEDRR